VSFNIAGEYPIKTVTSECFKSGRGYVIIFTIKNTLMSITSPSNFYLNLCKKIQWFLIVENSKNAFALTFGQTAS
jgi:hypothetical protein